jgi:hypothetical protein
MFTDLRLEISDRILAARTFFKAAHRIRQRQARAMIKGLMFVDLYAIYEYTVTGAVREALVLMKSRSTPLNTIRWELLGLALHREVTAVVDAGRETAWAKRLELFRRASCSDVLDVPDSAFPDDGSHFRVQQLRTIWSLFGMGSFALPNGHLYPLIEELVNNRNAIAHGRLTALEIGRRYSARDIASKVSRTRRLCWYLARALEKHCSKPANLSR